MVGWPKFLSFGSVDPNERAFHALRERKNALLKELYDHVWGAFRKWRRDMSKHPIGKNLHIVKQDVSELKRQLHERIDSFKGVHPVRDEEALKDDMGTFFSKGIGTRNIKNMAIAGFFGQPEAKHIYSLLRQVADLEKIALEKKLAA